MKHITGGPSDNDSNTGYRAPEACRIVGITYRQIDYWAREGIVRPSVRAAGGSGTQRLYSFADLVQLRLIKRLLDAGISLPKVRRAIAWLGTITEDDEAPLLHSTILSDGTDLWATYDPDDTQEYLMDILRRGQGVFAIAVGQVRQDLEHDVVEFYPRPDVAGEGDLDLDQEHAVGL